MEIKKGNNNIQLGESRITRPFFHSAFIWTANIINVRKYFIVEWNLWRAIGLGN
jgi:hypothetical protein